AAFSGACPDWLVSEIGGAGNSLHYSTTNAGRWNTQRAATSMHVSKWRDALPRVRTCGSMSLRRSCRYRYAHDESVSAREQIDAPHECPSIPRVLPPVTAAATTVSSISP